MGEGDGVQASNTWELDLRARTTGRPQLVREERPSVVGGDPVGLGVLDALSPVDRAAARSLMFSRRYRRGQPVYLRGASVDHVYVVQRGAVAVRAHVLP